MARPPPQDRGLCAESHCCMLVASPGSCGCLSARGPFSQNHPAYHGWGMSALLRSGLCRLSVCTDQTRAGRGPLRNTGQGEAQSLQAGAEHRGRGLGRFLAAVIPTGPAVGPCSASWERGPERFVLRDLFCLPELWAEQTSSRTAFPSWGGKRDRALRLCDSS